jgi:hypothetical protein
VDAAALTRVASQVFLSARPRAGPMLLGLLACARMSRPGRFDSVQSRDHFHNRVAASREDDHGSKDSARRSTVEVLAGAVAGAP